MRRVEVIEKHRLFEGFSSVDELKIRVSEPDGTWDEPMKRQSVERGDAAAVLVRNVDEDAFLLVRQLRPPLIRHGDEWLVEIVAGMIDEGETPEESAKREIEEEIGFRVRKLRPLGEMYGSPGGLSEKVWLYYAEVRNEDRTGEGGGVDEHEDVEIVRVTPEEARVLLRDRSVKDAKTQIALLRVLYAGEDAEAAKP